MLQYLMPLCTAFVLAIFFTLIVKAIAWKFKIVDYPRGERKIHQTPIPLLGGLAIFFSFFIVLGYYAFFTDNIIDGIRLKNLIGFFIASSIIMVGGILDDQFNLKPKYQIIWPILAVFIVIASGIGVTKITNPFGGVFHLDQYKFVLFWHNDIPAQVTILADLFTFFWLMGMMYTTKFLDGLDGLVSGITAIGALVIFFLANTNMYFQPEVAFLAIIYVGAALGFLIFNFHPAKIFLGEGGSLLTGFILGILAIIAGSKVITAVLIMGIPILDVLWVILRRIFFEKKSPFVADRKHLHFRLLDIGFSQRQAVMFLYSLAFIFGLATLFLQSMGKLIALIVLLVLMIVLGGVVVIFKHKELYKLKIKN